MFGDKLIDLRDIALLTTAESSGLSMKELALLTRDRIRPRKKDWVIVVNDKEKPLSREAFGHIQTWMHARPVNSNYIFTAFDGYGPRLTDRPVTPASARNILKKMRNMMETTEKS